MTETETDAALPICFVMMPISDPSGHSAGHFQSIFRDILKPACKLAGFDAKRANDYNETSVVHADVLNALLNAPMALCDLSARNPNVLLELGLRQAFDKPVTLVNELGTERIFDVGLLCCVDYRRDRIINEVDEDRANIAAAIRDTYEASKQGIGMNSVVKFLAITNARLPDLTDAEKQPVVQILRAELQQLLPPRSYQRSEAATKSANAW